MLLAALLTALALTGLSTVPAAAHAEVVSTAPEDGAAADRAPSTVSVRFSEAVQAASDGIRVLASDGTRVDRGDAAPAPGDSSTLSATLRSGLGQGTYTVAWRITSADSHPIHGAFAFTVGRNRTAAAPLAGVDRGADPAVSALVHSARGIGYLGLALLVGAAGAGLLLDGAAGRSTLGRQTRIGGLTLTLSAAVSLLAQGPYAAGTGLTSLLDPDLLRTTLSGRTGIAEALRVLLASALTLWASGFRSTPRPTAPAHHPGAPDPVTAGAVTADLVTPDPVTPDPVTAGAAIDLTTKRRPAKDPARVRPSAPLPAPGGNRWARSASYVPFVPLVALAATFSATGHPVAGRHVPLAFTADVLHLMAMGLWLGGLVALAALCTTRASAEAGEAPAAPAASSVVVPVPPPGAAFTAAVRRFSPLAVWCVGVLAVTGTLQSVRQAGSVDDLLNTDWGRYLLVKLAVVLALLAVAYRARAWTKRYAARRPAPPEADVPPTTLRTMRRTLAIEASIGAVILALSVMLAGSPPPSDRTARSAAVTRAAPASPTRLDATYDTGGAGGSGRATALLTSKPDGSVAIDLTLTTPDDAPAQPAELTAAVSLPAQNIGPLALNLEPSSPGHWTTSTTLTPKGAWQLALTIRTSDIDRTTVTFPATGL